MLDIPDHPIARFVNLWFNVGQAFRVPYLLWPRSIGGDLSSHFPADGYETELSALRAFDRETLGTVLRASGLGLAIPGRWLARLKSEPLDPVPGPVGPNRDERWFFVNGICSDARIARLNAALLTKVFHRPVTVLYNATEGVWLDLIECAFGKAWDAVTDAASANVGELLDALCDPNTRRVVLIAHSQGTIVAAVLLKVLEEIVRGGRVRSSAESEERPGEQKVSGERRAARRIVEKGTESANEPHAAPGAHVPDDITPPRLRADLTADDVGKLELYCFANCATSMEPFARVTDPCVRLAPWIESFGNEYDLVAKLGLLAPPHGIGSARIAGDRYRVEGAWGHLFNSHYGIPILVRGEFGTPFRDNLRDRPRLLDYAGGRVPDRMP
jgi:pimeloyl-ACP methyl ester carboxylesterase